MRYIVIFLMLFGLAACGGSQPNDNGIDRVQQKNAVAMIGFVRSDPLLRSYPQTCPASVYKTGASVPGAVSDRGGRGISDQLLRLIA